MIGTWILILIFSRSFVMGGEPYITKEINGFSSKIICEQAGKNISYDNKDPFTNIKFTCVEK